MVKIDLRLELKMVEARREGLLIQISFDSQLIAQILRSRAEKPSSKVIAELAEVGVNLEKENFSEIFLFDPVKKVEGYLWLYPDRREATFHTRVRVEVQPVIHDVQEVDGQTFLSVERDQEGSVHLQDMSLGFVRITNVTNVLGLAEFGHIQFENETVYLDIYHDCQHSFVAK